MKTVKIELVLWFLLITATLTGYAATKNDSRSYMEAHSELNGYVADQIDEMDGGN